MRKKILVIISVILIMTMGVYSLFGGNEGIIGLTSNVVKEIDEKMKVSGEISLEKYGFSIENKDIDINSFKNNLIKSEKIFMNLEEGDIKLIDFNGELKYDGQFELKGRCGRIDNKGNVMNIDEEITLVFDEAEINLEVSEIDIKNDDVNGDILINSKINIELDNDVLEIDDFSGNLMINNEYISLDGEVNDLKFMDNYVEVDFK